MSSLTHVTGALQACFLPQEYFVALRDPLAVYNAATNMEALFVRDGLLSAGGEAFVTEDVSVVGGWVGGVIPEIHKPQVWVERTDAERATPVLNSFERRKAELQGQHSDSSAAPVEVVCEDCGQSVLFPAAQ